MAKKAKRELSGIFDFWKKKKKEPEQKAVLEVFRPGLPALPAPPSLPVPAKPPKRPVFEVFRPETRLPAKPTPAGTMAPHEVFSRKELIPLPGTKPPAEKKPMELVVPSFMEEEFSVPTEAVEKVFAPPREEEPLKYVFVQPSRTLEPAAPGGELIVPGVSPIMGFRIPTPPELADHFRKTLELPALFDEVRRIRSTQEFVNSQLASYDRGEPALIPLDPVVYREMYTDFSKFYGIPWSLMDSFLSRPTGAEELWTHVIAPLNSMVADAFEILKPEDIPGFFTVSFVEPSMEYWLFYVEPLLRGPYEA